MWPQTAAAPYVLQPWNSAPLTGNPPEAIAAKQEREKRSHSFCRGFVFRVYARLNVFPVFNLPTAERIPATFLLSEKKAQFY